MGPGPLLALVLVLGGGGAAASGPHSLRYFYTGVSEPSPGLPAFVAVGYVDGETIMRYGSEQRAEPRAAWMKDNLDQQYWDRNTQNLQGSQQVFRVNLDTLQKRYNQSGGYHTVQTMYGCDLLEDGGIRGFQQYAYDGRDFLAFDKDTLTFTAADSAAEITKKKWEADEAIAEDWKHYLENTCIEWLQKYVKYGKATLERRERPTVRVSGKESHGFLTLSCRAHGFYPRSIAINWLRKGHVQAQETKRGSTAPNSDGTYHAWASIEALAAEKDEYQCRVEHASLPEPGLFSWEPESNLLPIVIGVVVAALIIVAAIAGFVFWKSRLGRSEKGYKPATGHDGGSSSSGTGSNPAI